MTTIFRSAWRLCVIHLAALVLPTCGQGICDLPPMPPEGVYHVSNVEELPVDFTSVELRGGQLTINYLDETGEAQFVVYEIREAE